MPGVLHIIDRKTDGAMLDQLVMLAGLADRVVSVGPPPERKLPFPVELLHAPMGSSLLAGAAHRDLLGWQEAICAWSLSTAMAGLAPARRSDCRLIVCLPHMPETAGLKRAGKLAADRRVVFVVPTESCRRRLGEALGNPQASIAVMPLAAMTIDDRPGRRERTRSELGLAGDVHLLIAPAEMMPQAGHRYACWVHAVLCQFRSDLRLLLPCGGPYEQSVRHFAEATGCGNEMFFTAGFLSLVDCLAAADVAMFFFSQDGGLSHLADAMAAGLPIVGWASDDVRSSTADGTAARLAPIGDVRSASSATLELLDNPSLRSSLGALAEQHARQAFSVHAVREIFTGLCGSQDLPRRVDDRTASSV